MAGLLRNLLTVLLAILRYGSLPLANPVITRFAITPFDTGVAILKSDRYFQLAEAAQLDMLIKTGLIGGLLRNGYAFVNLAQMVKFTRPVRVFSRVTVTSRIAFWDEKSAIFEHCFSAGDLACATVLVRMKFKKAGRTIAPSRVLGACGAAKPQHLADWEQLITSM